MCVNDRLAPGTFVQVVNVARHGQHLARARQVERRQ